MVNYRSEHKDDKAVAKTLKPKISPKKQEKALKAVEKSRHKK
jgi:hypothetical protein